MKALPTSGFSVFEISRKPYSGGAKFQNGDVLLARITPCLENGKTGVVDFLDGAEVGFGSTEFIVLRGKESLKTPYVACLSRYSGFRDHCIQSMVGSSGRQRVQNACFSNYFLALPDVSDLLDKFNAFTKGYFQKISSNADQIKTLAKQRDTLLPKLLSGDIRIAEAEGCVEEIA
jgi:type I restriction enzyme S subunit